jgi:acetyl-CoA acyltransferase
VTYDVLEAGAPGSANGGAKPKNIRLTFDTDEGPRADTSLEALGKLKPVFHARGVVTAGNSSQMSDGAAASVIMSAERARDLGLKPLARFVAYATAGAPPEEMGIGPVFAIPKALKIAGLTLDQIDVIELNEAFAAQALSVIKVAGLDPARVNVNGGAVALGHPIGASGARIIGTLVYELGRRGGGIGCAAICSGGGQGDAIVVEVNGV